MYALIPLDLDIQGNRIQFSLVVDEYTSSVTPLYLTIYSSVIQGLPLPPSSYPSPDNDTSHWTAIGTNGINGKSVTIRDRWICSRSYDQGSIVRYWGASYVAKKDVKAGSYSSYTQ